MSEGRQCPVEGCYWMLCEDPFSPAEIMRCPSHGLISVGDHPLALETDPLPGEPLEFEFFCSMLDRLAGQGLLQYSVSKDMSGQQPIHVTIENHGGESIDVRFLFDGMSRRLENVICYTDQR